MNKTTNYLKYDKNIANIKKIFRVSKRKLKKKHFAQAKMVLKKSSGKCFKFCKIGPKLTSKLYFFVYFERNSCSHFFFPLLIIAQSHNSENI